MIGINCQSSNFLNNTCSFGTSWRKQTVRLLAINANIDFLECMMDLASEPLESRLVQHLLSSPIGDGGQFDMVIVWTLPT